MIDVEAMIRAELTRSDSLPATLHPDWTDVLARVHTQAPRLPQLRAPILRFAQGARAVAEAAGFRKRAVRARRGWLSVLLAAAAACVVAGAGVAIADGFGAFDGIGAAQHPQSAQDALDPTLAARIKVENASLAGTPTGQLLADSTRFIRGLTSGERVYALTTTTNKLCVLIIGRSDSKMSSAVGCGDPLSQDEPTTTATIRVDAATPPLTYGVAVDGIASVSFVAGGAETTVPVKENVWAYEGPSDALESLTVHYADGRSQTLTDGRTVASNEPHTTSRAGRVGHPAAPAFPAASVGDTKRRSDWRAVINDLLRHRGRLTSSYPCKSVRVARTKLLTLPHPNQDYLQVLDADIRARC